MVTSGSSDAMKKSSNSWSAKPGGGEGNLGGFLPVGDFPCFLVVVVVMVEGLLGQSHRHVTPAKLIGWEMCSGKGCCSEDILGSISR